MIPQATLRRVSRRQQAVMGSARSAVRHPRRGDGSVLAQRGVPLWEGAHRRVLRAVQRAHVRSQGQAAVVSGSAQTLVSRCAGGIARHAFCSARCGTRRRYARAPTRCGAPRRSRVCDSWQGGASKRPPDFRPPHRTGCSADSHQKDRSRDLENYPIAFVFARARQRRSDFRRRLLLGGRRGRVRPGGALSRALELRRCGARSVRRFRHGVPNPLGRDRRLPNGAAPGRRRSCPRLPP
jgi:hypothetical protein